MKKFQGSVNNFTNCKFKNMEYSGGFSNRLSTERRVDRMAVLGYIGCFAGGLLTGVVLMCLLQAHRED